MVQSIVTTAILVIFYVCLAIIVFAPSLYAGWIYIISRRMPGTKKGMLKAALTTFAINAILVYFLFQLAFDYFLHQSIATNDEIARTVLRSAIESQKEFYSKHGRYYAVGPVRGPHSNEHGLTVKKDVILQVEPSWDKERNKATFRARAVHVLGRDVLVGKPEGDVVRAPPESKEAASVRSKLLRSVN